MHIFSTMELSEKIISLAQSDLIMRVRMANVSDLVASEGKYHFKCWVLFQRKIGKLNKQESIHDPCLDKLCNDIVNGLADGHVYDMGCVSSQYVKSCSMQNVNIPQKYQSRKTASKKPWVSKQVSLDQLTNKHICWSTGYPSKKSQLALAQQLATTIDDEGIDIILPLQNNSLQQLVHTALHIRNELENTEGHKSGWGGIDSQYVRSIIPESLYLFISILLGGTNMLDNDQTLIDKLHNNIWSIAQDIIYLASGKKKLTPKYIGLGLTLHQATRSEKLVEMFHAAGHTIGMDTIRHIDTTIASDILDRYEKNDNVYIPYEIAPYSPGRIILASCDNINWHTGRNSWWKEYISRWNMDDCRNCKTKEMLPSSYHCRAPTSPYYWNILGFMPLQDATRHHPLLDLVSENGKYLKNFQT